MKKLYILLFIVCFSNTYTYAQYVQPDSVVQLSGIIMTADSLKAVQNASITIVGQNRGTITNDKGIFSIALLKGDKILITSVGFKDAVATIPSDIKGKQHSMIQLLVNDTNYLPVVIIRPKPRPDQFARDFINADVDDDALEIARRNNDAAKKRVLLETLPRDAREATNAALAKNAASYYYAGQVPPQNIFSPIAWGKFINAWKRGDFKKKKK
jgi:hypothetical protein